MDLHSGLPYWLIKNGLPHSYPKLESNLETDVLILGGGISGALASYYLSEAGIKCCVLDARTIGLGSTATSTGLLQYECDTPLHKLSKLVGEQKAQRSYQLGSEAIDHLEEISAKIGFKDFQRKKSLYYASTKRDKDFIRTEYEARKSMGIEVALLDKQEILDQYSFASAAGILSLQAAQINPYLFTHALLQYTISKRIEVYDRSLVVKVTYEKQGVILRTQNGSVIRAKKIVYATGYEAMEIIKEKMVSMHSTYAIVSEQFNAGIPFWNEEILMWSTADPYLYIRSTADRRIMMGGRDVTFYNPSKRDKLIDRKRKALVADFHKLLPDFSFVPEFAWAGVFGVTKDGLPLIGTLDYLPNSYFALGYGGNGITFSVIAARIITDLIRGKRNEDAAIFAFR